MGSMGHPWKGSRRCGRCARAPGTGVPPMMRGCARPSPCRNRDQGAIAPHGRAGVAFAVSQPAIEPGTAPGVSVTDGERTLYRGGSREGSRIPVTSRVTGSFGHQARKAVGLAGLIETGADHRFDRPPDRRGAILFVRRGEPRPSATPAPSVSASAARSHERRGPPGRHVPRRRGQGPGSRCRRPSRCTTARMPRSAPACGRGTCRTRRRARALGRGAAVAGAGNCAGGPSRAARSASMRAAPPAEPVARAAAADWSTSNHEADKSRPSRAASSGSAADMWTSCRPVR